MPVSTVWLVAGHDSSGGAGLWRDVATARICAPELQLAPVVTTWTRQGPGVSPGSRPRAVAHVLADLAALTDLATPAAIKVGLVPGSMVAPLLQVLGTTGAPVVIDPVLRASRGDDLGSSARAWAEALADAPKSWIICPNRSEAAALTGMGPADPQLLQQLAVMCGDAAILLKDGHGGDPSRVCDELWWAGHGERLSRPRQAGPDPRGTGCALATAIACGLARGASPRDAVHAAVAWLDLLRGSAVMADDGQVLLPHVGPALPRLG